MKEARSGLGTSWISSGVSLLLNAALPVYAGVGIVWTGAAVYCWALKKKKHKYVPCNSHRYRNRMVA
jgi:hypothetical protein